MSTWPLQVRSQDALHNHIFLKSQLCSHLFSTSNSEPFFGKILCGELSSELTFERCRNALRKHTGTRTHAHTRPQTHTHSNTHAHMHNSTYAHARTHLQTHIHAQAYTHRRTHMQIHSQTHIHTHANTHTHTHTCRLSERGPCVLCVCCRSVRRRVKKDWIRVDSIQFDSIRLDSIRLELRREYSLLQKGRIAYFLPTGDFCDPYFNHITHFSHKQSCHVTHYTLTLLTILTLLMLLTLPTVLTCDDAVLPRDPLYTNFTDFCHVPHVTHFTYCTHVRWCSVAFVSFAQRVLQDRAHLRGDLHITQSFRARILSHDILFVPEVLKICQKGPTREKRCIANFFGTRILSHDILFISEVLKICQKRPIHIWKEAHCVEFLAPAYCRMISSSCLWY